jgi:phosphoribosylformimino-5-aminoimidazole carboxamide ribotide isomerase
LELYPAIDLFAGKAVRLLHGNYDEMTVYSDDPLAVAKGFRQAGARCLHLVDLEAARDSGTPNIATIKEICAKSGLIIEIGGGVRNMHTAEAYLSMGASRVIIGTSAVTDPDFLRQAIREFDDKVAVAVDIKGDFVATHGWMQTSAETCFDFCRKLENEGVKTVICTDISKDGALAGVNTQLYAKLAENFSMEIIASGGVHTINDLRALATTGVSGTVLGRAIYTGSIDLKTAIEEIDKVK